MKRSSIAAVVVAALWCISAQTEAKGVQQATVCGANGCRDIADRSQLSALLEGGNPAPPPSTATGWYRVSVGVGEPGHGGVRDRFTIAVLPDQQLLRGG